MCIIWSLSEFIMNTAAKYRTVSLSVPSLLAPNVMIQLNVSYNAHVNCLADYWPEGGREAELQHNKVLGWGKFSEQMAPSSLRARTNKFGKLITRFGYLAFIRTFSMASRQKM